jgi:Zn-dependent peptidase ImmA (M78 family)/DNA-binding XRE family transcriptional regulator
MTDIPIKPDLITWAREHRGLSQEQAADKLGMTVNDFADLERGTKTPNLEFFKRLSSRLKIPSGTLLRQTRPNVRPLPTDFRTIEGREPEIGFETRLAVGYARTLSENIQELVENEIAPPPPRLPRVRIDDNPDETGEAERARLNVSAVQQVGWAQNQAFRNWRTVIEAAGVYVVLKNFPVENCKGFTIFDTINAPIIVISKKERLDVARTFTLIHEYAHLLLRQPGFSDHDDRNPTEAFCNRFAAAFLVPRDTIRQLIGAWPNEPRDWDFDDIRNWARQLKVSQQALALRFENIGIAHAGFFNALIARQGVAPQPREGSGGNYVSTQVNELGDRFTRTVLDAERRDQIKPVEAADILDIRPVHFERVRRQIQDQDNRVGIA